MAQFFKKRSASGPSKNERKVQRNREAAASARAAGLLRQQFPEVQRLAIQMEFTHPVSHAVDKLTRALGPEDICDLAVPCPGRCGRGSFNLAGKIKDIVAARGGSSSGSGTCREPLYAGAAEVCGTVLTCTIEVSYVPESREITP